MMASIVSTVGLVLLGVVAAHLAGVACVRRGWFPRGLGGATMILIPLLLAGGALLWRRLVGEQAAPIVAVGALGLYVSGCLTYVQIRSVLSRGYSLRILVDLLERGGTATIPVLKREYANGSGLAWMVSKRLGTLSTLRLVRRDGDQVGPLTAPGRIAALVSGSLRRLLRLNLVG